MAQWALTTHGVSVWWLGLGKYPLLNALMSDFSRFGFTVLAFPSNQFGLQEPGNNNEILNCIKHVRPGGGFVPNFPIFSKVDVNGDEADPLFKYLKDSTTEVVNKIEDVSNIFWKPLRANDLRWNFDKFLVDHLGRPIIRYDRLTSFDVIRKDLEEILGCSGSESHPYHIYRN